MVIAEDALLQKCFQSLQSGPFTGWEKTLRQRVAQRLTAIGQGQGWRRWHRRLGCANPR